MINLLPPEKKEEILQEKKWKLIMILGILSMVFLVSFSLILVSINIFLAGESEVQKIISSQRETELNNPQMQALQKNLLNFNQTLSQLNSFYQNQFQLTKILEKISNDLPPGANLTNLFVSSLPEKEENWKRALTLVGFAFSREILLEFKKNLEKEELFGEVDFPPANWTKPTNINFTVSFKMK